MFYTLGMTLYIRRVISTGILFAFLANTFVTVPLVQAQDFSLPAPGILVRLSPEFNPPILKGIKVHPDNPFKFDFILDKGDSRLSNDGLKDESSKLIKYFLASLTIPEKDLWVNLSPYEKDRIIPNSFGLTSMGRDLLAEDYMLKQITASLMYPEDGIGKKFWKRIYEEAAKKFGTTNIPVNTFNKVWIIPDKAVVYENAKLGAAYVVESKLKVMLEQDYLSLEKHEGIPNKNDINALGSQVVREIVIPQLTIEVNENKNFAQLRQVYNSLILAAWYKKKIKDSILELVYADKNKVAGVNIDDPKEKERIYEKYLRAFKRGVYNYIKEDTDPLTQETIPRKYFSGGFFGGQISAAMMVTPDPQTISLVRKVGQYLKLVVDIVSISKQNSGRRVGKIGTALRNWSIATSISVLNLVKMSFDDSALTVDDLVRNNLSPPEYHIMNEADFGGKIGAVYDYPRIVLKPAARLELPLFPGFLYMQTRIQKKGILGSQTYLEVRTPAGEDRYFLVSKTKEGTRLQAIEKPQGFFEPDVLPVVPIDSALRRIKKDLEDETLIQAMTKEQLSISSTKSDEDPEIVEENIKQANRDMLKLLRSGKISVNDLEKINSTINRRLHGSMFAGILRGTKKGIMGVTPDEGIASILSTGEIEFYYPPSHMIPGEIAHLVDQINLLDNTTSLDEAARIYQRFFMLHPFADGNGRMARLLLDYMLLKIGMPHLPFSLLVNPHILYLSTNELAWILRYSYYTKESQASSPDQTQEEEDFAQNASAGKIAKRLLLAGILAAVGIGVFKYMSHHIVVSKSSYSVDLTSKKSVELASILRSSDVMDQHNENDRLNAIRKAGWSSGTVYTNLLLERISRDPSRYLRSQVLFSLGYRPDPFAIGVMDDIQRRYILPENMTDRNMPIIIENMNTRLPYYYLSEIVRNKKNPLSVRLEALEKLYQLDQTDLLKHFLTDEDIDQEQLKTKIAEYINILGPTEEDEIARSDNPNIQNRERRVSSSVFMYLFAEVARGRPIPQNLAGVNSSEKALLETAVKEVYYQRVEYLSFYLSSDFTPGQRQDVARAAVDFLTELMPDWYTSGSRHNIIDALKNIVPTQAAEVGVSNKGLALPVKFSKYAVRYYLSLRLSQTREYWRIALSPRGAKMRENGFLFMVARYPYEIYQYVQMCNSKKPGNNHSILDVVGMTDYDGAFMQDQFSIKYYQLMSAGIDIYSREAFTRQEAVQIAETIRSTKGLVDDLMIEGHGYRRGLALGGKDFFHFSDDPKYELSVEDKNDMRQTVLVLKKGGGIILVSCDTGDTQGLNLTEPFKEVSPDSPLVVGPVVEVTGISALIFDSNNNIVDVVYAGGQLKMHGFNAGRYSPEAIRSVQASAYGVKFYVLNGILAKAARNQMANSFKISVNGKDYYLPIDTLPSQIGYVALNTKVPVVYKGQRYAVSLFALRNERPLKQPEFFREVQVGPQKAWVPIGLLTGQSRITLASSPNTGGIDLTAINKRLQTNDVIRFHFDSAQLAAYQNSLGFTVGDIIIQPLINLRSFLGLSSQSV